MTKNLIMKIDLYKRQKKEFVALINREKLSTLRESNRQTDRGKFEFISI